MRTNIAKMSGYILTIMLSLIVLSAFDAQAATPGYQPSLKLSANNTELKSNGRVNVTLDYEAYNPINKVELYIAYGGSAQKKLGEMWNGSIYAVGNTWQMPYDLTGVANGKYNLIALGFRCDKNKASVSCVRLAVSDNLPITINQPNTSTNQAFMFDKLAEGKVFDWAGKAVDYKMALTVRGFDLRYMPKVFMVIESISGGSVTFSAAPVKTDEPVKITTPINTGSNLPISKLPVILPKVKGIKINGSNVNAADVPCVKGSNDLSSTYTCKVTLNDAGQYKYYFRTEGGADLSAQAAAPLISDVYSLSVRNALDVNIVYPSVNAMLYNREVVVTATYQGYGNAAGKALAIKPTADNFSLVINRFPAVSTLTQNYDLSALVSKPCTLNGSKISCKFHTNELTNGNYGLSIQDSTGSFAIRNNQIISFTAQNPTPGVTVSTIYNYVNGKLVKAGYASGATSVTNPVVVEARLDNVGNPDVWQVEPVMASDIRGNNAAALVDANGQKVVCKKTSAYKNSKTSWIFTCPAAYVNYSSGTVFGVRAFDAGDKTNAYFGSYSIYLNR